MRKMVLWGHGVKEYQEMFDLSDKDLCKPILEFGCGPSAFNSELTAQNGHVVSCDPLFALNSHELKLDVDIIFSEMQAWVRREQNLFDFTPYQGLDNLIAQRQRGMDKFFADYEKGKEEKRYFSWQNTEQLPFPDFHFDFALCSHYFFAALDDKDTEFYLTRIYELARVAKEVRIFPLVDRFGDLSPFVGPVLLDLQQKNFGAEVREVPYPLQAKGNAMLRVWAQQCEL